jgi:hypothetical protein
MNLQPAIDDYLGMIREDVSALGLIGTRADSEKRNTARDQLAAQGPAIVLPALRAATAKLSQVAQPNPRSIYGEGPTIGLIQCIIANAQELVRRIGPTAIPALLAAAEDPQPAVRTLAGAFLALLEPARGDIASLERLYAREQVPVTRVAMGGTLLYLGGQCSPDTLTRARREVSAWADTIPASQGDWRSWVRRQGLSQDAGLGLLVVGDQLDRLVYPQTQS